TFPFWENQVLFRGFLVAAGLVSAVIGTITSRVQSSIKSQVAYASLGQIGLIFAEIGCGFHWIALLHICGNAFLRTYQLLISPSSVSYKIKEQLYQMELQKAPRFGWASNGVNTLYVLSLKEWNLDSFMYHYIWNPIKSMGEKWVIFRFKYVFYLASITIVGGCCLLYVKTNLSSSFSHQLPLFFASTGCLMALKAFSERESVRKSWSLVMLNHVSIAIAISFNEHFNLQHSLWYLSGIIVCWFFGMLIIQRLRRKEWVNLDRFYGHAYEHPTYAFLFLLAALGISGFPITPTFVGEDLVFSHIHADQIMLAVVVSFSLIINGLASIRIYSRVFLGPHIKNYHGVSKRSF
ncbi:MAG: hypothetical protein EBV19_10205, partial [Flavobacteriia bacterium]|nr:hypothetical protein [Flavobacteriia bacterium]